MVHQKLMIPAMERNNPPFQWSPGYLADLADRSGYPGLKTVGALDPYFWGSDQLVGFLSQHSLYIFFVQNLNSLQMIQLQKLINSISPSGNDRKNLQPLLPDFPHFVDHTSLFRGLNKTPSPRCTENASSRERWSRVPWHHWCQGCWVFWLNRKLFDKNTFFFLDFGWIFVEVRWCKWDVRHFKGRQTHEYSIQATTWRIVARHCQSTSCSKILIDKWTIKKSNNHQQDLSWFPGNTARWSFVF